MELMDPRTNAYCWVWPSVVIAIDFTGSPTRWRFDAAGA
jgi:hypothetical protein